jgi:uncharacterized protein (TIGR00251 family)
MNDDATRISVRVRPGAASSEVVGWADGIYTVRIAAPPVDGKANAELVKFLSKKLGVARSSIRIIRGEKSRLKLIAVASIPESEITQRLSSDSGGGA